MESLITIKNKDIASMLGWQYVSSINVKEGKYDPSIWAGWWSSVPKYFHLKVNNHLYRGRSHNNLKFDSDYNWMAEALNYICGSGYRYYFYTYEEGSRTVITNMDIKYQKHSYGGGDIIIEVFNVNPKESIFNALYAFSQYLRDLGNIEEKRD